MADGTTYLRTTLTGSKFKVIADGASLPIDPTDTSGLIDTLGDFLLQPGVDPRQGRGRGLRRHPVLHGRGGSHARGTRPPSWATAPVRCRWISTARALADDRARRADPAEPPGRASDRRRPAGSASTLNAELTFSNGTSRSRSAPPRPTRSTPASLDEGRPSARLYNGRVSPARRRRTRRDRARRRLAGARRTGRDGVRRRVR